MLSSGACRASFCRLSWCTRPARRRLLIATQRAAPATSTASSGAKLRIAGTASASQRAISDHSCAMWALGALDGVEDGVDVATQVPALLSSSTERVWQEVGVEGDRHFRSEQLLTCHRHRALEAPDLPVLRSMASATGRGAQDGDLYAGKPTAQVLARSGTALRTTVRSPRSRTTPRQSGIN